MKACCGSGGNPRAPRWRGGLIALGLVLVAAPFFHDDAVPPPRVESRATPGRYTIFGTDVEVVGAFVELGSGADCEVRVTVRARSTR